MDGIVTAVEPQQRRQGRRVNVFVDGRYAFSLERDLADLIRVGQPIGDLKTAELLLQDEQARAFEAAVAFLSYRPRSERELRDRLAKKDVPPATLEAVVERLRRMRLLDDEEFARYWVEQRQTHRPRGSRLLRIELRRKGLADDTVQDAIRTAEDDEEPAEAAYRAGLKKARSLRGLDQRAFADKLGQFLLRRGFDYAAARTACRRLWSEVIAEGI